MARVPVGPTPRWFVFRALDGLAPKLGLVDALLATITAILVASVWRVFSGPRGGFEEIVPMLGTGLRWSVGLPIAWGALGAIDADRKSGLLDLARRRGVPARRWILGRALGAGTLIAISVGAPMVIVAVVLAGFGGGLEGAFARLSLVIPATVIAAATGCVFGLGGVVLGALFPSRAYAIGALVGAAALGALADLVLPGILGVAAHQLASPFLALEDLQAALFDVPSSRARGAAAAVAIVSSSLLGLYVATLAFQHERERAEELS